jgi:hypothetical protein
VTEYAATSTTTSTTTAAVATTTVVVGEYALCDPSRFSVRSSAEYGPAAPYRAFTVDDPVSCCHAAVSVPNAIIFGFLDQPATCVAVYAPDSSRCPSQITYSDSGYAATFGALSCGFSS